MEKMETHIGETPADQIPAGAWDHGVCARFGNYSILCELPKSQ